MKLNKLAVALISTGLMAVSSSSFAVTATTNLEARAGLIGALSISCTPLNFGVFSVDTSTTRASADTVAITNAADTRAWTTGGGSAANTGIAFVNGASNGNVGRAVCDVAGSTAPAATVLTVTFSPVSRQVNLSAATSGVVYGLKAPNTGIANLQVTFNQPTGSVVVNAAGAATFQLGGTLSIPAAVSTDNLGGYRNTSGLTITVDDGI